MAGATKLFRVSRTLPGSRGDEPSPLVAGVIDNPPFAGTRASAAARNAQRADTQDCKSVSFKKSHSLSNWDMNRLGAR